MNILKIVTKNMQQRALATTLTAISVALAVALTVAIVHIKRGMEQRFQQSTLGYEMVVGAKGSPLQLVLNTVFNLDISPGNIPWTLVEKLRADKRVKSVVPFSVGDNYKGFRIVGTTDSFGETFGYRLVEGRWFSCSEDALRDAFKEAVEHSEERIAREKGEAEPKFAAHHHNPAEAVIGATVAQETGLRVGQTFVAAHGVEVSPNAEEHTDNPWTIVGILAPTGTAVDRGLYINLDSFYHIVGHEVREEPKKEEKPEEKDNDPDPGQVSSVALKLRSPIHALPLYREINDGDEAMAAFPAVEIRKLFAIVGNIDRILLAQAILIGLVAGVAIAVSIYNSMSERRREIAILRALGARRGTIFAIVVLEAVAICAAGAAVGVVGGHLIVAAANVALRRASGFSVSPLAVETAEFVVVAGCIVLGALAGIGPAWRAYRTEVAEIWRQRVSEDVMTKNQIKSLQTAGMVCALLLVPATLGFMQQWLAQRKMVKLAVAEAAVPTANGYGKLAFDLLKSWTYIEGKSAIPGFIKELDGKNVEMLGFMMPLSEVDHIKEFLLVPSLWGCCYGQPPAVNHIVAVRMKPGQETKFYSNPVQVRGRFSVGETKQDGYVVSLYVLTVDTITEAKGLP